MQIQLDNNIHVLCWNEDVTLKSINHFELSLQQLTENNSKTLIVDFQGTQYMNSAGLGTLVDAVMRARKEDKQLIIVHVKPMLMEIFNIVKIGSFIKILPTRNEAVAYFNERLN